MLPTNSSPLLLPSDQKIGLLTPSNAYKPFRYPWAFEYWQLQQRVHWIPEEIPLGEDVKDWANSVTPEEKNLLSQIFRLFVQSDVEVNDNYMERYAQVFKPNEVKMMLSAFSGMETVHIASYASLIETVGMPDSEFEAFTQYKEMKDKCDYLHTFGIDTHEDVLTTLAVFGAFVEGLQLFASFAMLLNFPRFNRMKGMGQIVTYSVRDESLHCEGIIRLFHTYAFETGALTQAVADRIIRCCHEIIAMEDAFIDRVFEMGPVKGMVADDIKAYIRFIADWRLEQLHLPKIFHIEKHPLPWLAPILNGVEHTNFFESRATEYSKGATKGTWENVWREFDTAGKRSGASV